MALTRTQTHQERTQKLRMLMELNDRANALQSQLFKDGMPMWEVAAAVQTVLDSATEILAALSFKNRVTLILDKAHGYENVGIATSGAHLTAQGSDGAASPGFITAPKIAPYDVFSANDVLLVEGCVQSKNNGAYTVASKTANTITLSSAPAAADATWQKNIKITLDQKYS